MSYINDINIVSQDSNIPWQKLSGCNILVTGATGLIGRCLVDVLMSRKSIDYEVYASGRDNNKAKELLRTYQNNKHFHFIKHDVKKTLEINIGFEFIIHAASYASPNAFVSSPVEVMITNFNGVSNLIEYGLQHSMKRFLYVSSGEIYGEGDGREFSEDYMGYINVTSPRSCYPSSKRASETLCISYAEEYNADVVIARPCHVYGPGFTDSDNRVFAQFIRNIEKRENIVLKSEGLQFRSWCYVVNCASALIYILLNGESRNAYNIADESANLSIRDFAGLFADISGRKVIVSVPKEAERKGYNVVSKSIYNTTKLQSLGWEPIGTIFDNIRKTIEYRNSNLLK